MQRACLQVEDGADGLSELTRLLAGARILRLRMEVDPAVVMQCSKRSAQCGALTPCTHQPGHGEIRKFSSAGIFIGRQQRPGAGMPNVRVHDRRPAGIVVFPRAEAPPFWQRHALRVQTDAHSLTNNHRVIVGRHEVLGRLRWALTLDAYKNKPS